MKKTLKIVLRAFCQIAVLPLTLCYKYCSIRGQNDSLFAAIGQLLALLPGKTGSFLRVAFYSSAAKMVSSDMHIDFGSYLSHADVIIEDRVYVGAYCIIGKCRIGRETLIGSYVNILSGSRQHEFGDSKEVIRSQGGAFTQISIGEECWIGNNSVLMTDVGNRCVIGAGSVVVKEIPSHTVAVGNPCRVIRELSPK